eukprot:1386499-Pleurochrysis_carterae.AAC.2
MEVRTTAATIRASVAWDPRKHTIHASGSISGMGRSSVVRVRPWTSVGDENGMRARFAVHVGGLMQVRKAGTDRLGWVAAKFAHERAKQCFHRPTNVDHVCI